MTVIPFPEGDDTRDPGPWPEPEMKVPVIGTFIDAAGRIGSFVGTYQLAHYLEQCGLPAAAGVFAGRLEDADGELVGVGSRRHTAAVQVSRHDGALAARLGPLEINLLGFAVQTVEVQLSVEGDLDRLLAAGGRVR